MRKIFLKSLKYIFITAMLSCICSLYGITASAKTNCDLNHLMEMFPDEKYWNHVGSYINNPDGWTDTPCPHVLVDSGLGYDYYVGLGECNEFGGDVQCIGFVNRLVYEAYGMENYLSWEQKYDLENLKPGDVIRFLYDMHTVMVTSVDGNMITYGECNGNLSDCQIKWNVQKSKDEIYESLTAVYVAPSMLSVPLANGSYTSDDTIERGEDISFTAYGEGGSEKYTYKFAVKAPNDTKFTVIQNFDENTFINYHPDAMGDYIVKISVKDSNGETKTKALSFTVTKPTIDYDGLIYFVKSPLFLLAIFALSFRAVFNMIL